MPHVPGNDLKAIETLKISLELAKNLSDQYDTCQSIKKMLVEAEEQYKLDTSLPLDHPERKRFDDMFEWLKNDGAYYEKLKLRYYS